jgi:long-subunit acyl-CoA synthetase (AMP-forming)
LKGPNVFPGYFKNPERTKEAFSSDGFFKTGDVFRRDKHGNYYCVDRLKELIKYSTYTLPFHENTTIHN